MRSSSVKTLVVTISMFAVVSTAAVTAEARPARPSSRTAVSAARKDTGALSRAIATLTALQKRFIGVIANAHMTPPNPAPTALTDSTSTLDRTRTKD
jgi:hypothetical protein